MPFEHFRTQILLLHSEQSALDKLSAGFNDRYTVHCATSGSEALNTLGEVPIHVIVSAHKLPGMSGLEALREARKRSPDTLGILLAEDEHEGLEALVGDKEMFQIVRGEVTPDSLRELVEDVTQKVRLTTIADSANDQSADLNDDDSEHIVMETSENGATIITDSTGQRLALGSGPGSQGANPASAAVDVLVLTKDEQFLRTLKESARGMHNIYAATTLAQADNTIRKWNVGVVVTDAAMIGPNVEKLTLHLRKAEPRLVAIVAGRREDGDMLMELINRGNVYRFMLKPVSPGRARLAIEASVKQHLEAPDSAFEPKGAIAPSKSGMFRTLPKLNVTAAATADATASSTGTNAVADPGAGSTTAANKAAVPLPDQEAANDSLHSGQRSLTDTVSGLARTVGDSITGSRPGPGASNDPEISPTKVRRRSLAPRLIGAAAIAGIAVFAAFWLATGRDGRAPAATDDAAPRTQERRQPVQPVAETAKPQLDEPAVKAPGTEPGEGLARARAARDAGLIVNPPGENAIELYLRALESQPGSEDVRAELDDAVARAFRIAETALLEKRVADAQDALTRAALADPNDSRLPFLTAQLTQIQLRLHLDNAREAIRESRFEDAAAALDAASSLDASDDDEVQTVSAELAAAQSQQRTEELLAKAAASIEDGRLTKPQNNNARHFYELVLAVDSENTAASQGLAVVASKVVLQARAEIDSGDFAAAETLLQSATELDPESSELKASLTALKAARDRDARARREALEAKRREEAQKAAAEKARADKLAAEKAAAAEKARADKLAAEKAAAAEKARADKLAAERAATAEKARADKLATEKAAAEKAAAEKARATEPAVSSPADRVPADESAETTAPDQVAARALAPVSVSQLKRIKYVAPKYPRAAQRRNISGWVDVAFTVTVDGNVADIEIRDAEPGDTFVNAATKAIEGWKFEPVIENDAAVEKRAAVRLMFAID